MNDIIYRTNDGSVEIRLQFIVKNRLKYTHLGKRWPKHTQCLMYYNGLLNHFETIIKHNKDKDNPIFAFKLVAEKCLKTISSKWLRNDVRKILDEELLKIKEQL